jgi:hypothetical protein
MTIKSEEPILKKELVNMLFGMRSSACATYNNKLKLARSLSSKHWMKTSKQAILLE